MSMVGPFRPWQPCPECHGDGFILVGRKTDYQAGWGARLPENGAWVTSSLYACCDICNGDGVVTRKTLEWYSQTYSEL